MEDSKMDARKTTQHREAATTSPAVRIDSDETMRDAVPRTMRQKEAPIVHTV